MHGLLSFTTPHWRGGYSLMSCVLFQRLVTVSHTGVIVAVTVSPCFSNSLDLSHGCQSVGSLKTLQNSSHESDSNFVRSMTCPLYSIFINVCMKYPILLITRCIEACYSMNGTPCRCCVRGKAFAVARTTIIFIEELFFYCLVIRFLLCFHV